MVNDRFRSSLAPPTLRFMWTVRTERTSAEVAAVRAEAGWVLENWAGDSQYEQTRLQAVIDTLDWVAGVRADEPLRGELVEPNVEGRAFVEWLGEAQERGAIEQGVQGPPRWRPGTVALTLSWFAGDEGVDSPV